LSALSHAHGHGVAHRDVKPENLAVAADARTLKLLDFGSAAPFGEACCDMAGTMPFMSPEVLEAADRAPYTPSGCDVWSSGVVMLEMLCGLGKMNRMLGWEASVQPEAARCEELRAYFQDSASIRGALVADSCRVDDALLSLLLGMLEVDWRRRLSARGAGGSEYIVAVQA